MKVSKSKYLDNNLSILGIDNEIIKLLNNSSIYLIGDLWKLNRHELKNIGLNDNQINHIIIHLQLIGLDLNKKVTL